MFKDGWKVFDLLDAAKCSECWRVCWYYGDKVPSPGSAPEPTVRV